MRRCFGVDQLPTNYTLGELADLEAALGTGALRVTHGGTTTEYRSRADMMAQRDLMRAELGVDSPTAGISPQIRRLRFITGKGL